MAQGLLSRIRMLFEGDANIRKVADDPVLSAELVLLFRMILADGEVSAAEMGVLRRICAEAFGIDAQGLETIVGYLSEYGYETTSANALALFRDLDRERRKQLARHMAEIAKADRQLAGDEMRLMRRTMEVLSLDAPNLAPGR